MTSLYFDPALLEGPSDPEPREQLIVNGRYYLPPLDDPTGKRRSLQRVTNFIKQLSDTEGLRKWEKRTLVVGMARDERLYDLATSLSPEDKRDLDELIEKAIDLGQAGPSGGNITGTALHNYTDDLPGRYPIRVRDKWVLKVENLFVALHNKGLRAVPGLSERLVVSERYGTCGRLDDVYEDPFGVLRVGDRKSQKDFQTWWEVGAQLALYQGSDAMWNEVECRWEDMPNLADDFAHVAWMPLSHPAAKKGGNVDTVTVYDIPLAGPREVLEWCLSVRTLRTQARQWGAERVDLDDFARTARDIRDAESHDELRALAPRVNGDALYEMAANRWEALAATAKSEPAATPLHNAVRVSSTSNYSFGTDEAKPVASGPRESIAALASTAFGPGITQQLSTDPATRALQYAAADLVAPAAEVQLMPHRLTVQGQADAAALGFDPSLFVGPDREEATFLDTDGGGVPTPALPGGVSREAFDHLGEDVVNPTEIALATSLNGAPRSQAHPIATAEFANSKHADATVVELPGDAPAGLDAVPLKIVREIHVRAGNSKTSRGRVRLLNDLEKKYEKYQEMLLPSLLREWLVLDGLAGEPGFNKDGIPRVANTGGSSREPMDARLARGAQSLSDYLATKEVPKSAEVTTETEAAPAEVPDREAAPADDVAEVRKPYAGIEPDKHSMLRLIEMAKQAINGAERAKVFHEITRRKTWTGAIAAEINQHYLDNGYATENFDSYFEAQDAHHPIEHEQAQAEISRRAGTMQERGVAAALDTPEAALQVVASVEDRANLTLIWSALASKPWFADQALQEGLLSKMMTLKK